MRQAVRVRDMKRVILAVLAATLLLACDDSNPLIGKWRCATKSTQVNILGTFELTEKLVVMGPVSGPVKYSRDGARYIAATGDGRAFVFEKDGNTLRMVSPFECALVKV